MVKAKSGAAAAAAVEIAPPPAKRRAGGSPLLGRVRPQPVSCHEEVESEEASRLGRTTTLLPPESPLPAIPGLSSPASLHGEETVQQAREYREGAEWTRGAVLGTGAYSTCYQARDVETGTLMAAKQISFCRNSEEEQEKVRLVAAEVSL